MAEGLYDASKIPDDGWFFLKTMLLARDPDELALKEKRMRRVYHDAGGVDVPEIAEKAMGAKAQEHGLHGWPDWHIMGPDGWCGAVVRHAGMFAVTATPPFGPFFSELRVIRVALGGGHGVAVAMFLGCLLLFTEFGRGIGRVIAETLVSPLSPIAAAPRSEDVLVHAIVTYCRRVIGLPAA